MFKHPLLSLDLLKHTTNIKRKKKITFIKKVFKVKAATDVEISHTPDNELNIQ